MAMKENIIEQLSDVEHVLKRSSIYIGSITPTKVSTFVLDKDSEKFSYKEIEYVPGFLKIIYEILDNSVDECIRTNFEKAKNISVIIDENENRITVIDDGRGIPLKKMENSEMSMLESALTCLRAGSNFNDDEGRTLLGMNGVGSSLTNIFSKEFIADVHDGEQHGILECRNNLSEKKCTIRKSRSEKTGTKITFIPDLERFGLKEIDKTHIDLVKQRMMFLSHTYPEIRFKFNGEVMKFKNIKSFMHCFADTFVVAQDANEPPKYLIGVIPNMYEEFCHKSYINGADCMLGGTHLDFISTELIGRIKDKLSKKYPSIKNSDIKSKLCFIVNFREFENPSFNSQTKENFSSNVSEIKKFLKELDWDVFAQNILKTKEIIEPIVDSFKIKEEYLNRKTLDKISKTTSKFKCKKYMPATEENKYFAICEGDCLDKDTKIFNLSENCETAIKDLKIGDLVLTHNQRIKPIVNKSEKLTKCLKIKTKSGKEIICSEDHRFFIYDTAKGEFLWKKLKDIDKNADKLISNKLAKDLVLEEIKIEKNDDEKYPLKIYGEHFQYLSSPEHLYLVFNVETNAFEMKACKDIDVKIYVMALLR